MLEGAVGHTVRQKGLGLRQLVGKLVARTDLGASPPNPEGPRSPEIGVTVSGISGTGLSLATSARVARVDSPRAARSSAPSPATLVDRVLL